MGREGRDLRPILSRALTTLALASVGQRARAEAPAPPPPPPPRQEELSVEDREMLEVIDLLWELPLLEEWDPEEDAPRPIVEEPSAPPAAQEKTRP